MFLPHSISYKEVGPRTLLLLHLVSVSGGRQLYLVSDLYLEKTFCCPKPPTKNGVVFEPFRLKSLTLTSRTTYFFSFESTSTLSEDKMVGREVGRQRTQVR